MNPSHAFPDGDTDVPAGGWGLRRGPSQKGCQPPLLAFLAMGTFVAVDFETADRRRDSACALAIVRVEGMRVVASKYSLIRPPRRDFEFTGIHGISWRDVRDQSPFALVWRSMARLLDGAEFIAAHNAAFDSSVLHACCAEAGIAHVAPRFECTVALARKRWNLYPTRLPDVCRFLRVPLKHHDALSDATACARIEIAAGRCGPRAESAESEMPPRFPFMCETQ